MLLPLANPGAVSNNKHIYVMGGGTKLIHVYDADRNKWELGPEIPVGCNGAVLAAVWIGASDRRSVDSLDNHTRRTYPGLQKHFGLSVHVMAKHKKLIMFECPQSLQSTAMAKIRMNNGIICHGQMKGNDDAVKRRHGRPSNSEAAIAREFQEFCQNTDLEAIERIMINTHTHN
ncbi:kelch repeat protein [Necator americanus]|uniref:Kelch repeat protein n=1 Tax=Necator americanus TaxID=51031 RepID=W2SX28_NECAM|nr:kelch repeat protein [Necator americanus]ETN74078.1 kelch repeat protein [Necator americanus]